MFETSDSPVPSPFTRAHDVALESVSQIVKESGDIRVAIIDLIPKAGEFSPTDIVRYQSIHAGTPRVAGSGRNRPDIFSSLENSKPANPQNLVQGKRRGS